MKLNSIYLPLALAAMFLVFSGCEDMFETEPPEEIDPADAQSSIDGFEALAASMHYRNRNNNRYGNNYSVYPDILADNTQGGPVTSGRGDSQLINEEGSNMGGWTALYNHINEANLIIHNIDDADDAEARQDERDNLVAEAYFNRALAYFDLSRVYAYEPHHPMSDEWDRGVVIRTEPTENIEDADPDDPLERSSNQEVWDLIVEDIQTAIDKFETIEDRGTYYANYEAAVMFMAQAKLYRAEWDRAAFWAQEALDVASAAGVELVDEDTYSDNIFEEAPNPESIYEINIDPDTESLGSNDALDQWLMPGAWFDIVASDNLMALFDEDDVRLEITDEEEDEGDIYPYFEKYTGSVGTHTDNIPVMRIAELYLILAEAEVENGDLNAGLDALNQLRNARGLDDFETSSSSTAIDEILDERRRELAFEGHRFFDLKRRAMDVTKHAGEPTVPWDDYRIINDIPEGEVDDHGLQQNPGY